MYIFSVDLVLLNDKEEPYVLQQIAYCRDTCVESKVLGNKNNNQCNYLNQLKDIISTQLDKSDHHLCTSNWSPYRWAAISYCHV